MLEPEVMDSPVEALDYDAMDHTQVNRSFVDDLLAAGSVAGEVLDLGTGTAQIPIQLCRRHPSLRTLAVDLAESMLRVARVNIEAAELTERIQLDRVDAKQLPYHDARFACVMSNSIVHHSPEPIRVLAEAVRVLGTDGLLFFRDLVRPDDEAALQRLVTRYAEDANPHQQTMFADSLRASLRVEEIQGIVEQLGFPPDSVRQTSDRHWTWNSRKGNARSADQVKSAAAEFA